MDHITAVGTVRVFKTNKKTGEITYDKTFKNQITSFACQQAANLWAGQSVATPTQISVGTGANVVTSPADTALVSEVSGSRKHIDYATNWLNVYTQFSVTYMNTEVLDNTQPNGIINLTECGLWDVNGNLWSHVALSGVTHDNSSTLSIQWNILQQGN